MADRNETGSTDVGTLADPRPALNGAELAALSEHLGEPAAGRDARLAALGNYQDAPLPDRVHHLWRFTDPTGLLPAGLGARTLAGADVEAVAADPVPGAALTVDLWPGRAPLVTGTGDVDAASVSVGVLTPETGDESWPDTIPEPSRLFGLLNEAAWNTGLNLEIAGGAVLPGPVHVRVHAVESAVIPRLRIRVGAGAQATVVEEHRGGAATVVNSRTEVRAGAGARVRHVVLQTWRAGTRGYLSIGSCAERDADLLTVFGNFGGDRVKVEMNTALIGPGARSEMIGVALAAGEQRCDVHTGHDHRAGQTWSNIDFKAVVAGRARSSYTGIIRIAEEARGTEAYQTNRNLLLSESARADAIPELEILNEEVSCSHGATVAPVDPEHLFYLESRGLAPTEAMRLVVRGFLEKTLRSLPEALRPQVEEFVGRRLAALEEERG